MMCLQSDTNIPQLGDLSVQRVENRSALVCSLNFETESLMRTCPLRCSLSGHKTHPSLFLAALKKHELMELQVCCALWKQECVCEESVQPFALVLSFQIVQIGCTEHRKSSEPTLNSFTVRSPHSGRALPSSSVSLSVVPVSGSCLWFT